MMEDSRLLTGQAEIRRSETRAALAPTHGTPATQECWVARGRYAAFGVSWEVQADDISAYHLLLDRLPPGASPTSSKATARTYAFRTLPSLLTDGEVSFLLTADGRPLVRSSEPNDIAEAFEDDLKWLVAERSQRKVFLHAGVVGWRDRAILIPGGPKSGKSTLVRALVGCGATYFSDEYAVLEGNLVQPFPARLPNWSAPGTSLSYWLDEFASTRNTKPLPVGLVLFAPHQAGAVFKPRLLSRGKSLLGMFKHAVAAQRQPERVLRSLESVTRRCNALEGARGDAQAAATYLLERLV
jgi:hypothetical protein